MLLERTIPKRIAIELHAAADIWRVHADGSQLEQVLMNLAVNARDAMPNGGTLEIEASNVVVHEGSRSGQPELTPGKYVLIRVSDTGHGMDRATLEHIFDPFFTTKEVGKGTGLGLAMVYGIIKNHHGHITCRSQPGAGTAFEIHLPAIDGDDSIFS
jgi:signal transduction histidine kinase